MRKTLPGSAYHLCRARESGGEGEKHRDRQREQDCDAMVETLEIYRFLVEGRQFGHHHQEHLF